MKTITLALLAAAAFGCHHDKKATTTPMPTNDKPAATEQTKPAPQVTQDQQVSPSLALSGDIVAAVRHQGRHADRRSALRLRQGRAHARGPHRPRSARDVHDDGRAQGQGGLARSAAPIRAAPRSTTSASARAALELGQRTSRASASASRSSRSPRAARSMRPAPTRPAGRRTAASTSSSSRTDALVIAGRIS